MNALIPKLRGVESPILVLLACIPYDFKEEIICGRPKCHADPDYMAAVLYGGKPYALPLCPSHASEILEQIAADTARTRAMKGNATCGWTPPVLTP